VFVCEREKGRCEGVKISNSFNILISILVSVLVLDLDEFSDIDKTLPGKGRQG
jgi:hypothetical protein